MKYLLRFLSLLILLSPILSYSDKGALTYAPTVVELTGTLDLQTFPGPPNYESIRNGDALEHHFYLKLDVPVDVLPTESHTGVVDPEEERNVRIMQLAINGEDDALWKRFRRVGEGGHVKISGTLFHRFTGHHHSRVLLSVENMQPQKP